MQKVPRLYCEVQVLQANASVSLVVGEVSNKMERVDKPVEDAALQEMC